MSTGSIKFLSSDDVLRLHAVALMDQGGDPSIRDRGLLESALAMPMQQFGGEYLHNGIAAMAAAYAFHICKNHPFIDGNKRAATAAMIAFLSDNGWSFDATADEAEPAILALATGSTDKTQITAWVASHSHAKPKMELRGFFRTLTPQMMETFAESMGRSPNLEHDQTLEETVSAIPLLGHVELVGVAAAVRGDEKQANLFRGMAMLLIAIYRMAEDQGYEW